MHERPGLFASSKPAVLSLGAQAQCAFPRRDQGQFEVLVRHLLFRFFHNELLTSDDETKRVMQIAYTVALPSLLVSLYLFPAYHAFPPNPFPRPFWPQAGDHYFFVMYSFVVMGAATVYEWDLLFPDLLDVFVLSVLPISNRRIFFARVLALAIFLVLVLLGTSILGTLFFPLVADCPHATRHILGHMVAVLMSGVFASATFLALQGILLNTVGERVFRRITPVLQGVSIMFLLAILLLYPTLSRSIEPLLTTGNPLVRYFPPFWFLGVYEQLIAGSSALPIFKALANTACWAVFFVLGLTLITYPLAYRRRVRQLIEGTAASGKRSWTSMWFHRLLHVFVLRIPSQRAIFHFISQTILRSQRQRVMLAMYGGLGVALALANMLVLYVSSGHIRPALLPDGIRAAVPIMAFWTVAGLTSVVTSPIDRRGSWVFSVLIGRPRPGHLAGARKWITFWSLLVSLATASILHLLSPADMRTSLATATQFLVAVGTSFLLADIYLFAVRTVPFTYLRKGSITDLPLMVLRYFVLFPVFVAIVVDRETWIEASLLHLCKALIIFAMAHLLLNCAHTWYLRQFTLDSPPEESEDFPQRLGLREI